MLPTWIDTHCHLEAEDFRQSPSTDDAGSDERPAVIERARQAGVTRLVVIGSGRGRAEIDNAIAFAERYANIVAAIGVHPHEAKGMTDALWSDIERLATHPRVVAVGETGLDYYYKHSEPASQQALLRRFLRLAAAVRKPVSLHIRDAHEDARRIVREECGEAPKSGGVIHCFTGTSDDARAWLDLGFHISLAGVVTFKNADSIREAARIVPRDRLLLETDSPYLAPAPLRGRRNEPALLVHTATRVAELRGTSLERLADETRTAAEHLFGLTSQS